MSETLLETKAASWKAALDAIRSDARALTVSSIDARTAALERFHITTANREKPGRYWKIDLDRLEFPASKLSVQPAVAHFSGGSAPKLQLHDLAAAVQRDPRAFQSAFGRALAHAPGKYAALTQALHRGGALIHIPADVCVDEPIVVTYAAQSHTASFPYTLVVADRAASATVIERYESAGEAVVVSGITEIVAHDSATITHAAVQRLPDDAIAFFTRAAILERNARVSWSAADLGAHVCGSTIFSAVEGLGADSHIAAVFFPAGDQHVDFVTTTDHLAGESQSRTVIKSAAT
ncbi:MAG: SufD family Fe-S cluster assembly protein, partial [Candidatus Eremiobacteraeota bacterium]|nr:SufD family Fe-S cluster assembly protein [Candidatus Eremiobacteraeota bacterium]